MKPLLLRTASCALLCSVVFVGKSRGQTCPNNQPYSTVSYDTTAVGDGNDIYKIPQFDPSIGTLYSVDFSSEIYFSLAYTLVNANASPQDRTINLRRKDLLNATSPTNPTPFLLLPNTWYEESFDHDAFSLGSVPPGTTNYNHDIFNPRILTRSFDQSVVNFMGSDSLYLKYTTITQNALGFGSPDVTMPTTTVYDSMIFRITYKYCPSAVLPSTFIKLTAQNQNSNILLAWTSQQVLAGGSFELLKSIDGRTYTSVNKQAVNVNSLAGYNHLYKPTEKDPGKAFFRIKQTDQNGNVTYSKVITVVLPTHNSSGSITEQADKDLIVYPTIPAGNFVNVFIPGGTNTDEWTISIVSLAGRVMQQSKFSKTNLAKIQFNNPLAPGMYIVDAYNSRTQEHFKDKIVVQR